MALKIHSRPLVVSESFEWLHNHNHKHVIVRDSSEIKKYVQGYDEDEAQVEHSLDLAFDDLTHPCY